MRITRNDLDKSAEVLTRSIPGGPKFEILPTCGYYQLNINNHKKTVFSGSAREVYAFMQGMAEGIVQWLSI